MFETLRPLVGVLWTRIVKMESAFSSSLLCFQTSPDWCCSYINGEEVDYKIHWFNRTRHFVPVPGLIFSSILILLSMIWRTFLQLHYCSNSLCGTSKIESRCYVEIVVAVCCVFEFMRSKDADIVVSHLLPDRWCLHHRKGLTNPTFTNDYAIVFNFIRHSFAPNFNENRYSSNMRCINPIIAGMFNTNIGQRKLAIVQYPVRFA